MMIESIAADIAAPAMFGILPYAITAPVAELGRRRIARPNEWRWMRFYFGENEKDIE
jgi:hypothetical protein